MDHVPSTETTHPGRRPAPPRAGPAPRALRIGPATLAVCGLAACALITACADEPPELEVAGIGYTADELLGLPHDRKLVLGELVGLGLAVARGEAAGLADPLVERRGLEHLARVHAARRALDSAGVGDDVLRARYLTDPALELTVRHLLVFSERYETDETRAAARAKAERALERIRAGEPFPDVAAEVSEEPGAEGREGLLEPGREGAWVPEFWSAAVALEPGEVSAVTETQYGFHVLRLEARDTVPFDEVRHRVALEVAELMRVDTEPERALADLEVTVEPAATGVLDPGPDPDAAAGDGAAVDVADDDVAVRWNDGSMTVTELRRHLATLPAPRWEDARDDPAALEAEAVRAARIRAAAGRAREDGATVPAAVEAGVRQSWDDTLAGWTYHFGFREGMSDDAVRSAAFDALGATGQGPTNARDALHRRGPLIRLHHPVTLRQPDEDGG